MTTEEVRRLYEEVEELKREFGHRFPMALMLAERFLRFGEANGVREVFDDAVHDRVPVGDGALHVTGEGANRQ